jgi:hypothetical protein
MGDAKKGMWHNRPGCVLAKATKMFTDSFLITRSDEMEHDSRDGWATFFSGHTKVPHRSGK